MSEHAFLLKSNMADRSKRYKKIDFLGEGQVSLLSLFQTIRYKDSKL